MKLGVIFMKIGYDWGLQFKLTKLDFTWEKKLDFYGLSQENYQ